MLGQVKVEVKRQLIVITMRRSTVIEVDGDVIETAARSGDSARGTDSTKLDKRACGWCHPDPFPFSIDLPR